MIESTSPSKPTSLALSIPLFALLVAGICGAFPAEASKTTATIPTAASKPAPEACALLDDPKIRGKMDGLLKKLLHACDREHERGSARGS